MSISVHLILFRRCVRRSLPLLVSSMKMGALLSAPLNRAPDPQLPVLLITSHGKKPPLSPPPQLQFDIQSLKPPPRSICDIHNGMSRRLQEWANADPGFISCRDAIRLEIQVAARVILDEHTRNDLQAILGFAGVDKHTLYQRTFEVEATSRGNLWETTPANSKDGDGYDSRHEIPKSTSSFPPFEPELRVGINCLIGRHRSVAMVEALAKMPWPEWEVHVEHRDIWKRRRKREKTDRQGGRGSRQHDDHVHFEGGVG